MRLTFEEYMEFIASLTPEQAFEASLAFDKAMPPRLQLLLQKEFNVHMQHSTTEEQTTTETYGDGTRLRRSRQGTSLFTSMHDTITDVGGNEVKRESK